MRPVIPIAALGVALLAAIAQPQNMLPTLDRALRRFSDASNSFIVRTLTPAEADSQRIDPKAAASLDEDLDWRIAGQSKTQKGWHDFLAAHPSGKHAPLAQAALAKLEPLHKAQPPPSPSPGTPPIPLAPVPARIAPLVEVANETPRLPNYFAALERSPPLEPKVETIVKWREEIRTVTRWRFAHPPHHRARRSPPPVLSWFGPRAPYPGR